MKNNHNVEERITQALCDKSNQIYTSPILKQRVDLALDQQIMEESMKRKWSVKQAVILVAVFCLVLSMGVFAAGRVTGYATSMLPDKEYKSYEDIERAKAEAGFAFDSVESFSNGYAFSSMSVSVTDKLDESHNRVDSFKEWDAVYALDESHAINLYAHLPQEETNDERTPSATTTIDGIEVNCYVDHYKFVPVDYELTEEDRANEAKSNYFISVGTDEVEECDYTTVCWTKDNICYFFQDRDTELSQEELFQMVEEMIAQ